MSYLDDYAELVTKGTTPTSIGGNFTDSGINFLKVESISESGNFIKDKMQFIDQDTHQNLLKRSQIQENDILFSIAGTIGRTAIATPEILPCNTNQALAIIRPNLSKVNPYFLLYCLKDKKRLNKAKSNVVQSVQSNLSLSEIKKIEIPKYSLQYQSKISEVLKKFDDKIDLNQKMNETLEDIAKTLFKSWFIDFDSVRAKAEGRPTGLSKEISDLFPDSFEDSELGEIPKGWTINKIKDLGKVICGKTPPTKDKENYGDGFNFITIPDMHDQVFVLESSKTVTEKGTKTLKGKLLPEKTICVSCIATPGLTVIIDKPSFTNQQINSITPYAEHLSYFLFLNFRTLGSKISIYGGGGSVFENMSKSKFEEILIKTPDEKILKYFENHLSPIFEKILITTKENKILTEIRDTLLPKLISGELQIPSAENLIEEAGI